MSNRHSPSLHHKLDSVQQSQVTPTSASPSRGFFGHPAGVGTLVGLEVWERLSFYGLQAVLVYFMYYSAIEGGLGIDKSVALGVIGAYSGLVYLAAVGGGWVADRLLGTEKTLLLAAVIIMAGHVALSLLPGVAGIVAGLVLIALGSGGLKSAAWTVLGELYSAQDPRRDGGFSLYYMSINIGALLGPLATGAVWKAYGFRPAFLVAAAGMAVGLAWYLRLRRRTLVRGGVPLGAAPANPLQAAELPRLARGGAGVLLAIGLVVHLVRQGILPVGRLADVVALVATGCAAALWALMYFSPQLSAAERRRLMGYAPMWVSVAIFYALSQQQLTSLAVYADLRLNRTIGSFVMPPSWVAALNPLLTITLAGVMAALWTRLGSRQPSTPAKFALALAIMGIAPLYFVATAGTGPNSTPLLVLVAVIFLFTVAELMLSPVGIALASRLAPQRFPTRMMALHMLAYAVGNSLAGSFARYYNPDSPSAERLYFLALSGLCLLLAATMAALRGRILASWTPRGA